MSIRTPVFVAYSQRVICACRYGVSGIHADDNDDVAHLVATLYRVHDIGDTQCHAQSPADIGSVRNAHNSNAHKRHSDPHACAHDGRAICGPNATANKDTDCRTHACTDGGEPAERGTHTATYRCPDRGQCSE